MRAISSFMREVGIDADSCSARFALRMRVSMSAMGSVSTVCLLPARLRHSGHGALVCELAQADPADAELAVDRTRPAAPVAAAVRAHLVLGLALLLRDERAPVLVRLGRGGDGDVEPADGRDAVVVDLGKDDLLPDADRIVAAPVE